MIKELVSAVLLGCCLIFFPCAFAGDIPSTYIDISTVIESLQRHGYHHIRAIDLTDNAYHVDALSNTGKPVSLNIDSQTNQITKVNPDSSNRIVAKSPQISILAAINKVEKAGYKNIYGINLQDHDHTYHVKAYDNDDKQTELVVDCDTGDIKA